VQPGIVKMVPTGKKPPGPPLAGPSLLTSMAVAPPGTVVSLKPYSLVLPHWDVTCQVQTFCHAVLRSV
jgi:hypothetical protein